MTSSGPPKGETSPGTQPAKVIQTVSWRERFLWLIGRRLRFRVSGHSMEPILNSNDVVLVRRQTVFALDDVVLARHPYRTDVRIIKRISGFDSDGRMYLEGTNPSESTDSRTLGYFAPELLVGRVTSRFPRD